MGILETASLELSQRRRHGPRTHIDPQMSLLPSQLAFDQANFRHIRFKGRFAQVCFQRPKQPVFPAGQPLCQTVQRLGAKSVIQRSASLIKFPLALRQLMQFHVSAPFQGNSLCPVYPAVLWLSTKDGQSSRPLCQEPSRGDGLRLCAFSTKIEADFWQIGRSFFRFLDFIVQTVHNGGRRRHHFIIGGISHEV